MSLFQYFFMTIRLFFQYFMIVLLVKQKSNTEYRFILLSETFYHYSFQNMKVHSVSLAIGRIKHLFPSLGSFK